MSRRRAEVRLPDGRVETADPGHPEYTSIVDDDDPSRSSKRSAS